ncbi:hypothetical protein Tco_1095696 [Tanacetum coccineum]
MMQRVLPNELQNYLPDKIAKPIIELCSLFKQICSATLMEDDMLKAQIKVVDILCELELIYAPALIDIMVHLVIHLPIEALEGGPIRPLWMYPFERYMKKLKGYVRNKAKSEGSIAEGYVAEEALTFSSHYFWDVTIKFNRPGRNVDPPPPTRRLEINTYRSQFKSLFPNKYMQEEFPDWFGSQIRQRHVDNDQDPEVSTTNELLALANGPSWTLISVNSCVVDGVRYVVHNRDECRTTQNSGICSPGPETGEIIMPHSEVEYLINVDEHDGDEKVNLVKNRFDLEFKGKLKGLIYGRQGVGAEAEYPRQDPEPFAKGHLLKLRRPPSRCTSFDAAHGILPLDRDLQRHQHALERSLQYMHLQKAYNTNKASFKAKHWKADPTTGVIDVDEIKELESLRGPHPGQVCPAPPNYKIFSRAGANRNVDFMMSLFRSDSKRGDEEMGYDEDMTARVVPVYIISMLHGYFRFILAN